jgi:hypothetical protein
MLFKPMSSYYAGRSIDLDQYSNFFNRVEEKREYLCDARGSIRLSEI